MNEPTREEALAHFGIKGMRWGVRKKSAPSKSSKSKSSKNFQPLKILPFKNTVICSLKFSFSITMSSPSSIFTSRKYQLQATLFLMQPFLPCFLLFLKGELPTEFIRSLFYLWQAACVTAFILFTSRCCCFFRRPQNTSRFLIVITPTTFFNSSS